MAFGQPCTSSVAHQIAVIVGRNLQSERANQQQLPRCGLQQIGAAHDFCDLHRGVVGYNCELICRNIIAPPDHEVAEILPGDEALRALTQIVESIASPSGTRNRQFTPCGVS